MTSWSGWARPKGTAQVVGGRTGNQGFEVEGHGTDERRPFRRSPEPIGRRAVLMIPVIAGGGRWHPSSAEARASSLRRVPTMSAPGSKIPDSSSHSVTGSTDDGPPANAVTIVEAGWAAKKAGATQGKVIQVR